MGGRKNKTLGAIMRKHNTLKMLERYYKLHLTKFRSLNFIKPNSFKSDYKIETNFLGFKDLVKSELREHGFSLMRASKMNYRHFSKLLVCLNTRGIYFS